MDTKTMINQLKYEAEKHKNDSLFTGQTNITALCSDVIPKLEKLAEYETAEDEGRLVVIPYKIGMTLFLPRRGEVLPFKVVGTRIYTNRTEIDLVYFGNNECYKFLSTHPTTEYIEREYYKTREEAEKALKEMEGK